MIAYIKGIIQNIEQNSVIILTNYGIGYEIIINELCYSKILNNTEVDLYIYHNISENGQSLFGFLEYEDRILFKELIKISGVGGRVAQNILSLGGNRLKKAILEDDKNTIESIKGVGKKMAEKIVLELKDKDIIKTNNFVEEEKTNDTNCKIDNNVKKEIIQTLSMMGYNNKKVEELLQKLPDNLKTIDKIIPYIIKSI